MDNVDLQTALKESGWRGLRINLAPALFLSKRQGIDWRADISMNRTTASGREGKPSPVVTMVSNDGESAADLLRTVALLLEHEGAINVKPAA